MHRRPAAWLGRRDALAAALAGGLRSLLVGAGLVIVLLVTIVGVRAGTMPGVLLAAAAFLFLGACESLTPLSTAVNHARSCAVAASRLEEICDQRPAVSDPAMPRRSSGCGALALEHVTLRYPDAARPVLDRVSLVLTPGVRIALTGPSGAGKTTLAELLVRFRDPDRGRLTLDGLDARELTQADLRAAVLLCGQDAHLFNTTLRENLLIGRRDAGDLDLWSALADVELSDWAVSLPDGLDTRVGQQGELVSGGQHQRLALARALISHARFLILDEPAAHLDSPLAHRVLRRVLDRTDDRGLIVVTHASDDSLELYDRVLQLDDGRLTTLSDPTRASDANRQGVTP